MSRYRRVELHLKQLKELQSILNSIKTLSQLELHKLAGVTENQGAMVRTLEQIATDFLMFFPRPLPSQGNEFWLVFGSERSFCGGFNELLVKRLLLECPACIEHPERVLAVGRKLCERLDEALPGYEGLPGASASEEISSVLTRIAAATQKKLVQNSAATLWILYHNNELHDIISQRLLPPKKSSVSVKRYNPPILQEEPDRFFSHFLQHYLLLGLTQLFTVSLLAENEYRIRHLDGAIHRLDERLVKLTSQARMLRQEKIIEEIEVILLGSGAFEPQGRNG